MLKEQINCTWNIEWYNVNSISPTEEQVKRHEGEFLCYAIYPDDNGKAKSTYVIVSYNYKSKKWDIFDYILLYWTELPIPNFVMFL